MAKVNRTVAKGYFETGDKPTQGNYVNLIDSTLFLDVPNTGSVDIQGTGSFEGGINCIPTDGEGGTGSFGMISASGDISASGTGSFTGGINAIEGSGSFKYVTAEEAELTTTIVTSLTSAIVNVDTIREKTNLNGIKINHNITASANISASGFISAFGSSSLIGLPTTEPEITGALWLSGSVGNGSKYLAVFTG